MNFMMFNRASKLEYDAWAELGNDGWDWKNILPSFKSSTDYKPITDAQLFPNSSSSSQIATLEQGFIGTDGEIEVIIPLYGLRI